jgi:hypothetical protein
MRDYFDGHDDYPDGYDAVARVITDEQMEAHVELRETIDELREAIQLLNNAPINAMAFLVGFAEEGLGKTWQSKAVAEWADKVSEKGYGK